MILFLFLYLYSCVLGFISIRNTDNDFLFKIIFIFLSYFIVLFILNPIKWLQNTKPK